MARSLTKAGALLAAGGIAWSLIEAHAFILRQVSVPILPQGSPDIRVLHLSDMHMTPFQWHKVDWVRDLARFDPDLIVNTGDNLGHTDSMFWALRAMEPFADLPGVFTFGSNDYHSPQPKNPLNYLRSDAREASDGDHPTPVDLPGEELAATLESWGWLDLANSRGTLEIRGVEFSLVGLADAHMNADKMPARTDDRAAVHLGVTHSPYLRALEAFRADEVDLVLAGHTHGGQLCVPGYGALTTNCDLPNSMASGLHQWPSQETAHSVWLHVSAGLGTSRYTPFRFFCRPEATLLTLTAQN